MSKISISYHARARQQVDGFRGQFVLPGDLLHLPDKTLAQGER
jgi:hypothetical protein